MRRITELRIAALTALALAGLPGCGGNTAGLVLVFPSDQDKAAATKATILVAKPPSADGDNCPLYLGHPPQDPDSTNLELSDDVSLSDGVAQNRVKEIPTGRQTVLVKVVDSSTNIFLHGCKTTSIAAGDKIEIDLEPLTTSNNDLSGGADTGPVDDLTMPGPDMAEHHFLSVTVTELRDTSRKQMNATVTVVDSTGSGMATGTTDANGNAKVDVTGLVLPLQVTAMVPSTGVNSGAATIGGISPTFANAGTTAITLPVELDAPILQAANDITVNNLPASSTVDVFWMPVGGLPSDQQTTRFVTTGTPMPSPIGPLAPGNYRVAATTTTAAPTTASAGTPAGVTAAGQTANLPAAFTSYSGNTLTLGVKQSSTGTYPVQNYSVLLIIPAAPTQAAIPISSPAPITGNVNVSPKVPTDPSAIQPAATLMAEMTGGGTVSPAPHAEVRMSLTAGATTASFANAVPEPPTVSPLPTPQPQAMGFTLSTAPPSGFPATSTLSYVHVHIYDQPSPAGLYHWHIIVPAANPATITLPGGMIPTGTYTVDVAFVQGFTPLADGTVTATLIDDYTKLIRVLPQLLTQNTLGLTVN